jgi:hypothetical protein
MEPVFSVQARISRRSRDHRPKHCSEKGMEKVEEYKRLAIQARDKAATEKDEYARHQFLQIAAEWDALAKARLSVLALRGVPRS